MANGWGVYRCRIEDALAVVSVDLDLHARAPQPERPHLLSVLVRLRSPREDGLPQPEEGAQLHELEDLLKATLAEKVDAVYAGRVTHSGRQDLFFYAPSAEGARDAIQSVISRFPGHGFAIGDRPDPEWSHYRGILYPDDRELQCIQNARVLYQLRRAGDTLRTPREIQHYLYFPSAAARRTFAAAAQCDGFVIRQQMESEGVGGRAFGLLISRTDPVYPDAIDAVVLALYDGARELDGEYDGWETEVIRADPEASA